MSPPWFDAHLDLAYLAVSGRDMLAPLDRAMKPHPPAAATLPSLREGNVRMALGTIFTEVGGEGPEGYAVGDFERAFVVGRAQLEVYLTWRDRGQIALDLRSALAGTADVHEVRGGMGVAESRPLSTAARLARLPRTGAMRVGILMENADPIRGPDDLSFWTERGLVAVGLSWAKSSRYAGGNSSETGLTDLGRALVREMDRLGVVHDVSHLSDRAFGDLMDATDRMVIASHSNCRAIADPSGANQRHLTDEQVRAIVRRGGVIGLNLYSRFLSVQAAASGERATIDDCVRHIEHVCEIAGSVAVVGARKHVGLGSDLDGGFPADKLPLGIDSPKGYVKLTEALSARGWSDEEISDFSCGNWMRVFSG